MKKFVVTLAVAIMFGTMGQTQDVPDYLHEIETHFVNPCLKIAAGKSGVPVSDEFIEMIKTDQPQFAPLVTLFRNNAIHGLILLGSKNRMNRLTLLETMKRESCG